MPSSLPRYFRKTWRLLTALLLLPLLGWGQSTTIVISQVFGAGGNSNAPYTNDFIELHNLSNTTQSVEGFSVQYSSAAGTSWVVTNLTGSIPAGGYYLIQEAAGTTPATSLPAPDATGTIALSGTNGKVALVGNQTALSGDCATNLSRAIDLVGYGTTPTCFEGSKNTGVALTNSTAALRINNGCTDTNQNSADFTTDAPNPRNSASPLYNCTTPALTPSPASRTGFTYAVGSGPSASQNFTLNGSRLTAGPITATAPTDYELSLNNGTFSSSVSLAYTAPTLATTTIYVRLKAGLAAATYANEIISFSGGGATSSVMVSGSLTVPPVLTVVANSLSGFGTTQGTPSVAQSYTLTGTNLTADVVVTPPAGYQVSQTSATTGFAADNTALTVLQADAAAGRVLYVRLTGTTVAPYGTAGAPLAITNASTGATTQNVAVSGTVVTPLVAKRWMGTAGTNSWFDAANWEGNTLPGPGDDVVFDHRYVTGSYTVVLGNSPSTVAVTIASLRLRPLSGEVIEVIIPTSNMLPATTTDSPALTLTRSLSGDTALSVGNRAVFTNSSGAPAGSGSAVVEVVGTTPTVFILNGGSYRHQTVRSVSSLLENLSAATGTEAGNFYYRVPQASYATITAGITYGNLIFQRGGTNAGVSSYLTSGSMPLTINGSLIIENNVAFAASLLNNIVLRGNLQNTGNFRFSPNNAGTTARLVLQGTLAQSIAGTALADPSAGTDSYLSAAVLLEINNPAGVTLRTPVAASNALVLTTGLLTTDAANVLTLTGTATVQGGANNSFVNGPVRRPIGPVSSATAFVFPVGKGQVYRPITLTVNTQTSTTVYRAEQVEGNTNRPLASPDPSGTNLTRVNQARYFMLTPFNSDAVPVITQPLGFTGTVTLSYGPGDGVTAPSAASLVIAKRADATQPWTNAGRQGASSTASVGTVTSGNITSFSDFALGSTDPTATTNPLPVQLTAFTATSLPGGAVSLAWATASEANSARFEVERSTNGVTFALLSTLAAQGYSAAPHTYATRDATAPIGSLYYRLRLVDTDGTAAYSPVAVVATSLPGDLLLAPNPAHDYLHLTATLPTTYTVRSILGQALVSGTVASGPARVPVAELPAGVYFMELRTATSRVVQRFVKN